MIKYGIDSFVLSAPWSLIVSILMFSGTTLLGKFTLKYTKINLIIKDISNPYFQWPIFGFLLLLLIIYPLILFKLLSVDTIRIIGLLLILLNFYYLIFYKKFSNINYKLDNYSFIDLSLVLLLIFGYFLISLGPITSADSLDYHSATAIHIVNFAEYPTKFYWFHSRISGSGETLIALGLSIGAEQYGSLVQFSGLLSIIGLIVSHCKKNDYNKQSILFFVLLFLIIPVLIFLNSTNKPQLMPVALTSICFVLIFFRFDNFNQRTKLYSYLLIVILLVEAFLLKYSFVLSGLLIGFYSVFKIINKKNYLIILFFTLLIISVVFVPLSIWKYINFGRDIFYSLFLALPEHLYGYDSFMMSISSCGYNCYPTWFFVPRSLNEATNFFGVLFCFLIFLRIRNIKNLIVLFTIIIYIFVGLNYGQSNPRFFFEPAIWFLFLLIASSRFYNTKIFKYLLKYVVRLQALFIIIIIYFAIFTLLPGSLYNSSRVEILNKNANGYSLLNWASKTLQKDDVILSTHRSVAIPTIKVVPGFFINYLDIKDKRAKVYLDEIKSEKPNYIIFTQKKNIKKYKDMFNNCLGEMVFFKEKINNFAARNPFISGYVNDGYIYEFNYEKLPGCLVR
jgi:hypothetical protein